MSLIAWYPLNGNLINQGIENATLNDSVGSFVPGKTGQGLQGPSKTYFWSAEQTSKILNGNEMSFAFWVYIDAEPGTTGMPQFFGEGSMGVTGNRKFSIFNYPSCNDFHLSWQKDGAQNNAIIFGCTETKVFPSYKWTHCCITYKEKLVQLFINGVLHKKYSMRESYVGDNFNYRTPVFRQDSRRILCDYRVYNHALSQKEIHELSKGLFAYYTLNNPIIENAVNLTPEKGQLYKKPMGAFTEWTNQSNGGSVEIVELDNTKCLKLISKGSSNRIYFTLPTEQTTYTYSMEVYSTQIKNYALHIERNGGDHHWDGGNANYTTPGKWQKLSVTLTNKTATTTFFFLQGNIDVPIYCRNIQIEKNDHATLYAATFRDGICADNSGFGNNATYLHNPLLQKAPGDTILSFHCIGDNYITTPECLKVETEFTMNIWGYMDNWTNYTRLISCTEGGGWNIEAYPNRNLSFAGYDSGVGYVNAFTNKPISTLSSGWHMFTLKFDTNNLKGYVDGVLLAISANYKSKKLGYNSNNTIFIGAEAEGSDKSTTAEKFNGYIKDFKMYATALSDNDIKQLYQSKAAIDRDGNFYVGMLNEYEKNQLFKTTYQMSSIQYKQAGRMDEYSPIETFKSRHTNGIYLYNQKEQYCEITNDGIHFFCKPNLVYTNPDGTHNSVMYGGLAIQPLDVDINTIQKGHTYIFIWRLRGKYSRYMFCSWTHNMGWGGGGLDPTPSNVERNMPNSSFNGEKWCYYKFTVSDDVWKTCTNSYSNFVQGQSYPSYCQFTIQHTYGNTGAIGTDAYIDQFQMYDVTELVKIKPSISAKAILSALGFDETPKKQLPGEMSDMMIKTLPDHSVWARIFWHNNNGGTQLFANEAEALNTQTNYKYSRLYLLNDGYFKANGKYEFLLEYPGDNRTQYNRWKQSSNPCISTTVEGYEPIHVDWTGQQWGGLLKGSDGLTFLKGSTGGYWYYAIGSYTKYKIGIPDYTDSTDNIAQLWIRIDNNLDYKKLTNQSIKTFVSSITYTPEQCLDYSTRNSTVQWLDVNIVGGTNYFSTHIGEKIILIIPCSNGTNYFSYQTIHSAESLLPIKTYWVSNNTKESLAKIYKSGIVTAYNFIEI